MTLIDALLTLIDYYRRIIDGVTHIWVDGGVERGRRRSSTRTDYYRRIIDAYRLLSTNYRHSIDGVARSGLGGGAGSVAAQLATGLVAERRAASSVACRARRRRGMGVLGA